MVQKRRAVGWCLLYSSRLFYDVYSPFVRRLCYVCVLDEAAYKDVYFLVYIVFSL